MNLQFRFVRARSVVAAALCVAVSIPLVAEGDAAFGFDQGSDTPASSSVAASSSGAKIGGSITAGSTQFLDSMDSASEFSALSLGNLVSGTLNLDAEGSNAAARISLGLRVPTDSAQSPFAVKEAFVRGYFGSLDLEAGLRKLTWGKADSQGPLDVVNPLDLTDLTVTDSLERKIARPMLHASYGIGDFTKVEGVFVPWFVGHSIAKAGRWTPYQLRTQSDSITAVGVASGIPASVIKVDVSDLPSTTSLEYWQGGARVTTTIASNDIGLQYYYGLLPRPAYSVSTSLEMLTLTIPKSFTVRIRPTYNRYQQVGADWAAVIAGFNARAEVAANLTSDFAGTDAAVYNPAMLWSLGFDRTLIAGISVNLQGSGSVRLQQDGVSKSSYDVEYGKDLTHTTLTGVLSKKFLKDELELKCTGLWGIEDADYLILPAVVWTKGDISAEATAGFFGGSADGELGEYSGNSYLKVALTYSF